MLSVVSRVINVAIMLREAIRYVIVVPLMTYSVMPFDCKTFQSCYDENGKVGIRYRLISTLLLIVVSRTDQLSI